MNTFFPFGPPLYISQIDPKYVTEMLECTEKAATDPKYDNRALLAGQIDDQYSIIELASEACGGHILQHVEQYKADCGVDQGSMHDFTPTIDGLWVNIQRYRELNPMHTHDGLYSFVIFLKNELNREETLNNKFDSVRGTTTAGHLTLRYGEQQYMNWNVYQHWPEEGQIIIFPSWLQHMVMPHYEKDKIRVSVAGNIQQAMATE